MYRPHARVKLWPRYTPSYSLTEAGKTQGRKDTDTDDNGGGSRSVGEEVEAGGIMLRVCQCCKDECWMVDTVDHQRWRQMSIALRN